MKISDEYLLSERHWPLPAGWATWALAGFQGTFMGAMGAIATGGFSAVGTFTLGQSMLIGFAGGFAGGLVGTGSLKGALMGGFAGAIAGGIGHGFENGLSDTFGRFKEVARATAHGINGGTMSEFGGGSFQAGFLGGAFGSLASHTGPQFQSFGANLVKAAVVGGTAAKLGGGRFENGAISAAFQHLFNEGMKAQESQQEKNWFGRAWDMTKAVGSGLKEGLQNIRDSLTFTHGPKVGVGVKVRAFGSRVSLLNVSGGASITSRGDGSAEFVYNFNADLFKLSYENLDAGIGWGSQFGIGKESSGRIFAIDETRSALGLPSYNLNSGNYSINHSEVSAAVTWLGYEVGIGFDWKVMFGIGGED